MVILKWKTWKKKMYTNSKAAFDFWGLWKFLKLKDFWNWDFLKLKVNFQFQKFTEAVH